MYYIPVLPYINKYFSTVAIRLLIEFMADCWFYNFAAILLISF